MIVTFSCRTDIFVYESGCGYSPRYPYKTHKSIEEAKNYLLNQGKKDIHLVYKNSKGDDKLDI